MLPISASVRAMAVRYLYREHRENGVLDQKKTTLFDWRDRTVSGSMVIFRNSSASSSTQPALGMEHRTSVAHSQRAIHQSALVRDGGGCTKSTKRIRVETRGKSKRRDTNNAETRSKKAGCEPRRKGRARGTAFSLRGCERTRLEERKTRAAVVGPDRRAQCFFFLYRKSLFLSLSPERAVEMNSRPAWRPNTNEGDNVG